MGQGLNLSKTFVLHVLIALISTKSLANQVIDISDLPQQGEKIFSSIPGDDEPTCKKRIPAPVRNVIFHHYVNAVRFFKARGQSISPSVISKWAHLTGMIMKESSGDSNSVTDMKGHEKSTYKASTNLARWSDLMNHDRITYDKQTNYGIAQQSPDRLKMAFEVSTELDNFLTGMTDAKSGQSTRKLFDMYQQFAQGRLRQEDQPIPPEIWKDTKDPEIKSRIQAGLDSALWHCGTQFLFQEGSAGPDGQVALEKAMASIAYCNIDGAGDSTYACAAKWLTLCPALNIDIALLNPDSYFQTSSTPEACRKTFEKLTTQYGLVKPAAGK